MIFYFIVSIIAIIVRFCLLYTTKEPVTIWGSILSLCLGFMSAKFAILTWCVK